MLYCILFIIIFLFIYIPHKWSNSFLIWVAFLTIELLFVMGEWIPVSTKIWMIIILPIVNYWFKLHNLSVEFLLYNNLYSLIDLFHTLMFLSTGLYNFYYKQIVCIKKINIYISFIMSNHSVVLHNLETCMVLIYFWWYNIDWSSSSWGQKSLCNTR